MSASVRRPDFRLGHASDPAARTGCTVLLGPFRGACFIAGHATGTRELDSLSGVHLVPQIDALLLTGGSAFGLAAADGVVAYLEERSIGYDTGVARVPIVPAAVIFDLGVGRADRRPDAAMARAACEAATTDPPAEGQVGVGTGATAGKVLGRANASPAGFGWSVVERGEDPVMAMAVVNPLGDVMGDDGRPIAGALADDGSLADSERVILSGEMPVGPSGPPAPPGTNTTLGVIVVDAPLPWEALHIVARMAAAALARRIRPVFSPFDGDIVFALSTSPRSRPTTPAEVLAFGTAASVALERAIVRAVDPAAWSGSIRLQT